MTTDERQQRMAERILEDERLRGDLEDDAATALIGWASERAVAAAADPTHTDAAVEAQVQAIRQAVRAAALSGETAPQRLIALAAARLAPSPAAAAPPAAATRASEPAESAKALEVSAAERAAPAAAAPVVREMPAQVSDAVASARPTPDVPPDKPASGAATRPAGSASNRSRRKRSRLARYYKRGRGGR